MELFGYRFTIERVDTKQDFIKGAREQAEKELFETQINLDQINLLIERAKENGHDEDYIKKQQTGVEHYKKNIQAHQATLDVLSKY